MNRGKQTCNILKEIRQQIAEKNDIEYITSECNFKGECQGTCPKCEEELEFLENELKKRKQLGNAAIVAGVSLGIASTFSSCDALKNTNVEKDDVYYKPLSVRPTITSPLDEDRYSNVLIGYIAPPYEKEIEYDSNHIYQVVEDAPQFPGGDEARQKFLRDNLRYRAIAGESGIQGTVFVSFVIEKDGSITDVKIVRGIDPYYFDKEAIRVVEMMPKWIPGKQQGKEVRVQWIMPIRFTLAG